jgi:sugar phosphate isomerase/epimerase
VTALEGQIAAAVAELEAAAAECAARVREPDADHPGDWICSMQDALDIVRALSGDQPTEAPA